MGMLRRRSWHLPLSHCRPRPPDRAPPLPRQPSPSPSPSPRAESAAESQSGGKEDYQPRPRVVISSPNTTTNTPRVRPPIPKSSLNIVETVESKSDDNDNYSDDYIYADIREKFIKAAGGRSSRYAEREKDNPYLTIGNATGDEVRAQHYALARRLDSAGREGPLEDLEEYLKGVGGNKRDRGFKRMMEELTELKMSAARADAASQRLQQNLEGAKKESPFEETGMEDSVDNEPVMLLLDEAYDLRQILEGATTESHLKTTGMETYFDDEPVIHPLHMDHNAEDESLATEKGRLAAYIHPAFRSENVVLGKQELELLARNDETTQYVAIPDDVRAKMTALYKKKYEEKKKLEAREGVKKRKLEEENERIQDMSLAEAGNWDFTLPDPEIPESVYDKLRKEVTVIEDGAPNPNPRPLPIEQKDERAPWWTFPTEYSTSMKLALHTMNEEYEDGHWQDIVNAADEAERAEKLLPDSAHTQKLMEELVLPTWKTWNLKKRAKAVVEERVRGARAAIARRDESDKENDGDDPDLEDAVSVAESYNPEMQDVGFEGDAVVIPAVAGALVVWFMSQPESEGIDVVDILGEAFLAHAEMGPPPAAVHGLLKDEEARELFEKYKKMEVAKGKRNERDDDMWEDINEEEEAGLPKSNTQMVLYTGNRTSNFHAVAYESLESKTSEYNASDFQSFAYSTFVEPSADGTLPVAETTRQSALEEGFKLVDVFSSPCSATHSLHKEGTADASSVRLPSPGVEEALKDERDAQGMPHSATLPFSATILNLDSFADDTGGDAGEGLKPEGDEALTVTEEAYVFNCFPPPTPDVDVERWFQRPHVSILNSEDKHKVNISLVPSKPILFSEDESEGNEDENKVDGPVVHKTAEFVIEDDVPKLTMVERTDWIRTADEYKHGLNGRPQFTTRLEEERQVTAAQQPDNRIYMSGLRGFIERGYFSDILPKPLKFPESTPSELSRRDAAWAKHCLNQRIGLLLEDQLWNRMRVSADGGAKQKWVKPKKRYPRTIAQGHPPPKNYVRKEDTQAALVMAVWQTLCAQQLKKELDASYTRGPQRMIKGAPVAKEKERAASTSKSLLFKDFPAYTTDDEVDAHDMSGDVTAVLEEIEQDKQEEAHVPQLDVAKMTDKELKRFSTSAASVLTEKFPELVDDWNDEERRSFAQRSPMIENKRLSGLKPKRGVSSFSRPTSGVSSFSAAIVPSQTETRARFSFSGRPNSPIVPSQEGAQGVPPFSKPFQSIRRPSSPPIPFPVLNDGFAAETPDVMQRDGSTLPKDDSNSRALNADDVRCNEKSDTTESVASKTSSAAFARNLRERREKATANIEKRLATPVIISEEEAEQYFDELLDDIGAEVEVDEEESQDGASNASMTAAQAFALIDWYLQRNNTEDISIVEFLGAEFLAFALEGGAQHPVEVTDEEAEEFFAHYGGTWVEQAEGAEVLDEFEVLVATSHRSSSEPEAGVHSASGPEKAAESGTIGKDRSEVVSKQFKPSQVRDFVAYNEKNGKPFKNNRQIKAYMELPDDAPPREFTLTRRENGLYNQMLIEKRVAYEKRKQAYEKGEFGYGLGLTQTTDPKVKPKRKVLSMLAEGSVSTDSTLEEQGHVDSENQEGEYGKPFAQQQLADDYFGHWEDVSPDLGGLGIVLPKRGKRTVARKQSPEKEGSSSCAFGLGLSLPDASMSISPNIEKSRQRYVSASGPTQDSESAAKIAHDRQKLRNFSSPITPMLDSPASRVIQRGMTPRSKKPVGEGRYQTLTFDDDSDSEPESSAIGASNVSRLLFRAKTNDGVESRPKDDRRRSASFFRPLLGRRKLTLRNPFQSPSISWGWDTVVSDTPFPLVEDGGTPVPASALEELLAKGEENLTEEDLEVLAALVRTERLTRILAAVDQAVERSYQIALENEAKKKRKEKRAQAKVEAERKAEARKRLEEERREDILEAEAQVENGIPDALAKVLRQHAGEDARSAQEPPDDPNAILEERARRHAQAHHGHLYALDPKAKFEDALMIAIKAECLDLAEIEYLFQLIAKGEADAEKGKEKMMDQFYHVQEHQERMQLLAEQAEWEGALARVELWRQAHAEYVDPNYFIPEEISVPEGGDPEVEELDNEAKDECSSEASADTGIVYQRVEALELADWMTAFKENQLKRLLRSRRTTEATNDSPKLSSSNKFSPEEETSQVGVTPPERRKSLKIVKRAISIRRSIESAPKVFAEPSTGRASLATDRELEEPSEYEESMHASRGSVSLSGGRGDGGLEADVSRNSPDVTLERRKSRKLVKRRTIVPSGEVASESLSKPSVGTMSFSRNSRPEEASVGSGSVPGRQFSAGSFSLRRVSVIAEPEGYHSLTRTTTAKSEVSLAPSNDTTKSKSKKKWNLSLPHKSKDKRSGSPSPPSSPADAAPPKASSELERIGSLFKRKEQKKKD